MGDVGLDLSILIVSHGHEAEIAACLASLPAAVEGLSSETVVVDNLGGPGFADAIGGDRPGLTTISNPTRRGFGANVNAAARKATGEFLLVLNPDTEHRSGRIAEGVAWLRDNPGVGLLAARLVYPDGTDQRNYRSFPTLPVALLRGLGADSWKRRPGFYRRRMLDGLELAQPARVDWVFGSFMLIRRDVYDAVGGFDESYFMYYEDVDLCLRLRRRNLATVVHPGLVFVHHHHRTSAAELFGFHRRAHMKSLATYLRRSGYLFSPPY
jgi:GT2 family glycosyltransferase